MFPLCRTLYLKRPLITAWLALKYPTWPKGDKWLNLEFDHWSLSLCGWKKGISREITFMFVPELGGCKATEGKVKWELNGLNDFTVNSLFFRLPFTFSSTHSFSPSPKIFGLTVRLQDRRAHCAKSDHISLTLTLTHTHSDHLRNQGRGHCVRGRGQRHTHTGSRGDRSGGFWVRDRQGGLMKMRWDGDTGPLHRSLVSAPPRLGSCVRLRGSRLIWTNFVISLSAHGRPLTGRWPQRRS